MDAMPWVTVDDVAAHLGIPKDDRMAKDTAAALAWAHRRRHDLDPAAPVHADIHKAVVIYASLLYRERSSPQGFATYEGSEGGTDPAGAMANVYRLLGTTRPVIG